MADDKRFLEPDAWKDLEERLDADEQIEGIVFGEWGWGGYREPEPSPVPPEKRGVLLNANEAIPLMKGWSFFGGFGAPTCYAVHVWTNKNVIVVQTYDGSTCLVKVPRHPDPKADGMYGGG